MSGGGLWVVHWFLGAASGDGGIVGAAGRGNVIGGVIFLSWGWLFRRIVTLGLRGGRLTGEGGGRFFWGSVGPFGPSWIWLGCPIAWGGGLPWGSMRRQLCSGYGFTSLSQVLNAEIYGFRSVSQVLNAEVSGLN